MLRNTKFLFRTLIDNGRDFVIPLASEACLFLPMASFLDSLLALQASSSGPPQPPRGAAAGSSAGATACYLGMSTIRMAHLCCDIDPEIYESRLWTAIVYDRVENSTPQMAWQNLWSKDIFTRLLHWQNLLPKRICPRPICCANSSILDRHRFLMLSEFGYFLQALLSVVGLSNSRQRHCG